MKSRCNYAKNKNYDRYGARGITVCTRWQESFEAFLEDMGLSEPGMTLDRFPDQEGNYEPGNCRWATKEQQAQNKKKQNNGHALKTHCRKGHEYSGDNLIVVSTPTGTARQCRECGRLNMAAYRKRQAETQVTGVQSCVIM
jgi:hypothetical protein